MTKMMSSVDTKKAVQIIQNIAKIPYIYEDSYLMWSYVKFEYKLN